MTNIAIALSISFLIPLGYLNLIQGLDLFGTRKFHYNLTTVLWGIAVYAIAAIINSIMLDTHLVTPRQLLIVVAPLLEEILKSGLLFYLVRRTDFNYVVDGAIYGFGTGLGFAMIENYDYVMSHAGIAIALALSRVLSTNLVHATSSGLIGGALAVSRLEHGRRKTSLIIGGLICATLIHAGFNAITDNELSFIHAVAFGFVGTGLIIAIIQKGLKTQQIWIVESLGMTDRITPNEAIAVQRIHNLDDVLSPVTKQFGPKKALQTEALLLKQAEIGIKRKILEKTLDEKKREDLESKIQSIAADMDNLRKAIGPYCMLFVRTIYSENESKIWDVINQRVSAASTGQAGGGLWSKLDNQLKESKLRKVDHE